MALISIDGNVLRKMMICGANNLTRHSNELDALNVFPVPDGDTGINMSHTVQAAAKEAQKLNSPNVHEIAKAASNGALRGARGNSGVILSQLFRGFAKGLEGKSVASASDLGNALVESSKMAYRAVMKPKEGTILTISRALGEYAKEFKEKDIELGLAEIIKGGNHVLSQTPNMLPALKQAGVVDSGGKGLMYFVEGALAGLSATDDVTVESSQASGEGNKQAAQAAFSTDDIKFVYCTEFLIDTPQAISQSKEEDFTKYLTTLGDSIVVVSDDNVIKVHVHTNNPGLALERALKLGALSNIKIDNQKLQHTNAIEFSQTQMPEKDLAFVTVAAGSGFTALFKDLGADYVIEGGQTMNPSAEDIAQAVSRVNSKKVVVLPNNKNIILAAEQAVHLVKDKEVFVVPTRSIPQGVACLINYMDSQELSEYIAGIGEIIDNVHSGQVTYAVRDTVINERPISQGDILCIYDGDIVSTGKDIQEASKELLEYMIKTADGELISIYYGEEATKEMADELAEYIREANTEIEVEVYGGGQPLYYYVFSIE